MGLIMSILDDHLDTLNDLVLNSDNCEEAELIIRRYCEDMDLDPDGYDLIWAPDEIEVIIAE